MATQAEIEKHYDTVGALHALRLEDDAGGYPDYTAAFYDGDFTKTLTRAQKDKHEWVLNGLGFTEDMRGKRVLDIGCGWGPILNAVRERGGEAIGLTLSPGQVAYCHKHGLDARLKDYKDLKESELGVFNGIVSLGAFEHFCSLEDKREGKQVDVYKNFFKICADRLRSGDKLFLQTMTWGKTTPDPKVLSLDAPADSMEAIVARITYLFPGSWLPDGLEQLIECAKEKFDFVSSNNGRLDYLQTFKEWNASTRNLWKLHLLPSSLPRVARIAFHVLTNRAARVQWQSIQRRDLVSAFSREIISHERIFFVRK